MREGKIKKHYLTLVEGSIEKEEIWEDELIRNSENKKTYPLMPTMPAKVQGNSLKTKKAITKITPLLGNKAFTLILAEIETGRTHQIRSQAAGRGHPVSGDKKYGAAPFASSVSYKDGFFLHAWRMELPPPLSLLIEAPLPEKFQKKICKLFGVDSIHFPEWL
jgi:23S rRNA pseudouridine955/2504/2580 synthase